MKKIKAILEPYTLEIQEKVYKISGEELTKLQNIIKNGFIKYYNWILKETNYIILSKETMQEMNRQWKNRKK